VYLKRKVLWFFLAVLLSGCGGGGSDTDPVTQTSKIPDASVVSDTESPVFTTQSTVAVEENLLSVMTVHADDARLVRYDVSGGSDSSCFSIDSSSGFLTFKKPPDFEAPADSNRDNRYEVSVSATDTSGNRASQDIYVTVTDFNELYANDADGDYIPNEVETLIGSDPNNADEDSNGIEDGLDTQGMHGDTFFDMQWYIHSLGNYTNDSNVLSIIGNDLGLLALYHNYMGYNHGDNIIIQVVDTGIDTDHEDLKDNMDLTRSYDGETVGDPVGNHPHGTMVAGIMAARAFNAKGVRGIIPFARIAGSNWLSSGQSIEALEKAWLSGEGANEIAVSNNSWGRYSDTDTDYEDIMELGSRTLRDGRGRIYVFAAGNDRTDHGNANLQYILSNRYAIAVAALKHDNTYADYSSPGANILISGYGGNNYDDSPTIGTTTVMGTSTNTGNVNTKNTWENDVNGNYTYIMNGTSAASPTVAASIALVLEACPDLTWRDVRYLVARHAKQVDPSKSTWVTNGSGLKHSIDYGFGLINAQGIIDECSSAYVNLPIEQSILYSRNFNTLIADNNTTFSFEMNVTEAIDVEWVEVTVDSNSTNASDYRITLKSPENTKITLMTEGAKISGAWMEGGFRFSTPAMMDESSLGVWTIDVRDTKLGIEGSLTKIGLKIYGHEER